MPSREPRNPDTPAHRKAQALASSLIFETRGLPKAKEFQEKDWGKSMNNPDEFPGMSGVSVVVACENGFVFTDAGGKVK